LNIELFWDLTPREFFFVYDAYQKTYEQDYQTSWEQTRIQIYYQYCSYPKKGMNPSYTTFKARHFPFSWDKVSIDEANDVTHENRGLTPDDWIKRIAKIQSQGTKSRPLGATELKSI